MFSKQNLKCLIVGFISALIFVFMFGLAAMWSWFSLGLPDNEIIYYLFTLVIFGIPTAIVTFITSKIAHSHLLPLGGLIGATVYICLYIVSEISVTEQSNSPLWYTLSEPVTFILFGIFGAYVYQSKSNKSLQRISAE